MTDSAIRIARAFLASVRSDAKKNTHPINPARGMRKDVVDGHATPMESPRGEDYTKPAKNDIRPEDVFAGTPNQVAVLNLAETGKDMQNAIRNQIPKDRGYDTVKNLSQYLIETKGGGGTPPVGKR